MAIWAVAQGSLASTKRENARNIQGAADWVALFVFGVRGIGPSTGENAGGKIGLRAKGQRQ